MAGHLIHVTNDAKASNTAAGGEHHPAVCNKGQRQQNLQDPQQIFIVPPKDPRSILHHRPVARFWAASLGCGRQRAIAMRASVSS